MGSPAAFDDLPSWEAIERAEATQKAALALLRANRQAVAFIHCPHCEAPLLVVRPRGTDKWVYVLDREEVRPGVRWVGGARRTNEVGVSQGDWRIAVDDQGRARRMSERGQRKEGEAIHRVHYCEV